MSYAPLFVVTQRDTLPDYTVVLSDQNGNVINLTTATSVDFVMTNFWTGNVADGLATIVNAAAGKVQYAWTGSETNTPGVYSVEWLVTWSGGATSTYPLHEYDIITVVNDLAMGYPGVSPVFNTIYSGSAAPTSGVGNNGDFYYQTSNGYFYGPKAAGTWPSGFLLNPALLPLNDLIPNAALNMQGYKITSLGNGQASTDAANYGQIPKMGVDVTQAPYNADPTGTNDCTAAFNTALTALNTAGGQTLLVPPGKYVFSGTSVVSMNGFSNVQILGAGGFGPTSAPGSGTQFYYNGTGSADFIQMFNTLGCSIRNVSFNGSSSAWTGNYINFTDTSVSSNGVTIENCYFYGGNTTSASAINLSTANSTSVKNCVFVEGVNHIIGGGSGTTTQSSTITIDTCYFYLPSNAAIYNPGVSWVVKGCNSIGANGVVCSSTMPVSGLTVLGSNFSSASYGVSVYGNGITIQTCTFSTETAGVNIFQYSTGLTAQGNNFNGCTTGIVTIDTVGTNISNNTYVNCTTATNYNATSTNLIPNGNFNLNSNTNPPNSWTTTTTGAAPTLTPINNDGVEGNLQSYQVAMTTGQAGIKSNTMTWTANKTYQVSCWIKLVSGTGAPALYYWDAANSYGTNSSTVTSTGVWTKVSFTIPAGNTTTTPTPYVYVWNSVSGSASTFKVASFVARQGTTLLPDEFSLTYLGNTYTTVTTTLSGAYTQCGIVEDPVGEVTRYGTGLVTGPISQTSGYDTVLGNNLYLPNVSASPPTSNFAGAAVFSLNGAPWSKDSNGVVSPMISPPEFGTTIPNSKGATLAPSQPNTGTVAVATTGVIYATAIWLPAGTVVSNVNFVVGTSSTATQSHAWVGLYDTAVPGVVAVSADRTSTLFTASPTVPITMAFSASYTTLHTGLYWILFSCTTTGTMPALAGLSTAPTDAAAYAVQSGTSGTQQAPPTLGTTFTMPTTQATGIPLFWLT